MPGECGAADGQGITGPRWATLNQRLNSAIYPDYSLSCLSQFCLGARPSSQSQVYKALLIHCFMKMADLLHHVYVRHKFPPAGEHFYTRGPGGDQV